MSATLLRTLQRQGLTIKRDGDDLIVKPSSAVTHQIRQTIKANKKALLDVLLSNQRQHLTGDGELIIPHDADPKYHYWAGGQTLQRTLEELNAPAEVRVRYVTSEERMVELEEWS